MAAGAVKVNRTAINSKKCAVFDGVDDIITIPYNAILEPQNFTISGWAKPSSSGGGTFGRLYSKDESNGAIVGMNGEGLRLTVGWLSGTNIDTPYGVWTHFTFIKDGTNIWRYKNGVKVGVADNYTGGTILYGAGAGIIGGRDTDNNRNYDGAVGDLRLWGRVLTDEEITKNYNGARITKDLIGEWKLGKDYKDTSIYGNDGINSGTYLSEVDDAIAAAIKADRTTANDIYLLTGAGKQNMEFVSTIIEESP